MNFIRKPTTVSDRKMAMTERELDEFSDRIQQNVERILEESETDRIRNYLKNYAFTPNDALPKRSVRPTIRIPYLSEQIYLSHNPSEADVDTLVQFVIVKNEYYDITDDIFDGDVSAGSEPVVYVTNELLTPVLTRLAHRLGDDAVSYWTANTSRMVCCFLDELQYEPSKDTYLDILEKQSHLYGICTGLASASAGGDAVEDAEQFGKLFYKFEQFCLDAVQRDGSDPDPWNAWRLMDDEEVLNYLNSWQTGLNKYLDKLPKDRANKMRALIALDLESWHLSTQTP